MEQRMRRHLRPANKWWRVDETYLKVKGRWCYLYRAIDSAGATIDFLLLAPIYTSAIPAIKGQEHPYRLSFSALPSFNPSDEPAIYPRILRTAG